MAVGFQDLGMLAKTWRCWITDGDDMASGWTSSLTDADPRIKRPITVISLRLGPRAPGARGRARGLG
jgi:hypothetical protein